jgi:hypothetical protein
MLTGADISRTRCAHRPFDDGAETKTTDAVTAAIRNRPPDAVAHATPSVGDHSRQRPATETAPRLR